VMSRRGVYPRRDVNHLARGPDAALLGLAYWTAGNLEEAHRTFGAGMDSLRAAGDSVSAIGGSYVLAEIRVAQGRLGDAIRTQEHALRLAAEHTPPVFPGVGNLYLGLADQHERQKIEGRPVPLGVMGRERDVFCQPVGGPPRAANGAASTPGSWSRCCPPGRSPATIRSRPSRFVGPRPTTPWRRTSRPKAC
jgi:hypothetical protein